MWKYVGLRLRLIVEGSGQFQNVRSNFSTSGHCIGKTTACDDHLETLGTIKCYRKSSQDESFKERRCEKPKFSTLTEIPIIFNYEQGKQQSRHTFKWRHGDIFKYTAGFLTSLCVGQVMCLYSRRRQIADGWLQIEQALHERRIRQIFSGEDTDINTKNGHQSSYVKSLNAYQPWPIPVANDQLLAKHEFTQDVGTPSFTTQPTDDINAAVSDLFETLGHIEFKLGLQNVASEKLGYAVENFKSATVHRHPEATFNLGVCYELGLGVDKSMNRAMECYRMAASLGHKKALFNLGVFYAHGYGGLEKNKKAAKACFKAAGELGLSQAQKVLKPKKAPREPMFGCPMKRNQSARTEHSRLLS